MKSQEEKHKFINFYKSIVKKMKCSYCSQDGTVCDKECPEIKGSLIKPVDRRRILNLSKKYFTFGTVIFNKNVYSSILNNPSSKGRFTEYVLRRTIKKIVLDLIGNKALDPSCPIYLHINIDEMPTKSNGYYSLKDGLMEELKYGIKNYDYGVFFNPIINGDLFVEVRYKDSSKDYGVQMADIIANTIRKSMYTNPNWFETRDYLQSKIKIDELLKMPQ